MTDEVLAPTAAGGPPLFRARSTPELLAVASERFGLSGHGEPADVGGINLNIHLPDAHGRGHVLRVYAPWVTGARVRFIQETRSALRGTGLPFTETIGTTEGDTIVV